MGSKRGSFKKGCAVEESAGSKNPPVQAQIDILRPYVCKTIIYGKLFGAVPQKISTVLGNQREHLTYFLKMLKFK